MRAEKSYRQTSGAICCADCDHEPQCRVLRERPIPLAGKRPGGWSMIGCRGYRIAEPPRTSSRPACSAPATEDRPPMRIATQRRARAPPSPDERRLDTRPCQVNSRSNPARHGTGPAEAPPAQANHAPPESDYGTQPTTERSYGMTSQTTSASAQCKGSFGRSSWGIVQAGCAMPSLRGTEAEP